MTDRQGTSQSTQIKTDRGWEPITENTNTGTPVTVIRLNGGQQVYGLSP